MQNQDVQFTKEEIQKMIGAFMQGVPLGEIVNLNPDTLEALYGLGFNLYEAKNYTDAHTVFQALCMYKHNEYRFLMGLAACKQALKEYQAAIDMYGFAIVASMINNPEPFYYSVFCLLKLNRKQEAIDILNAIPDVCEENNAEHAAFKTKAKDLLNQLKA